MQVPDQGVSWTAEGETETRKSEMSKFDASFGTEFAFLDGEPSTAQRGWDRTSRSSSITIAGCMAY
jgi:hypothetical protein